MVISQLMIYNQITAVSQTDTDKIPHVSVFYITHEEYKNDFDFDWIVA